MPLNDDVAIRLARATDIASLPSVEAAAGQIFRDIGMPAIADDTPPATATYVDAFLADRLWVAAAGDKIVGYSFASVVDDHAHLEQASIVPEFQRRGVGKQLILTMCEWAIDQGLLPISLTTFANVPWNAPYYRTFGFVDAAADQLGPELAEVLAAEHASDLGRWNRICMFKMS